MLELWKETIETLMNQVINLEWYEYALMYFAWHAAEHAGATLGQLEHDNFYRPISKYMLKMASASWTNNKGVSSISRIHNLNFLLSIYDNNGESFVYTNPYGRK